MSHPRAEPCAFIIFGISGDLAARKLMPALFALQRAGALHPQAQIVGFARREWSDDALREHMQQALKEHLDEDFDSATWQDLAPRLHFVHGHYDDAASYQRLGEKLEQLALDMRLFYTATPPSAYPAIIRQLQAAALAQQGDSRLIIEKPFGHDLASAQQLNALLLEAFREKQIYRIDHYLAKETAQNIAALRFANTFFEPTWNSQYLDHVQVTMAESIGVEGRGGFYEAAGVVRDVFQNHLLQLVALTATEPPARYDAQSVRDEKVKVFRSMRCLEPSRAILGQYSANAEASSYREESGVDPDSRQATYVAAELRIDNWRWAGVPFFVRTGKGLKAKASEIVLYYKTPPHIPFKLSKPVSADRIILRLVPDEGIALRFDAKVPGQGISLHNASLDFYYGEQFKRRNPDAYETLILDAMLGDATLFMRNDEVEAQWRIVDPLLQAWESSQDEPAFYAKGSWGPEEAEDLMAHRGRRWHSPKS